MVDQWRRVIFGSKWAISYNSYDNKIGGYFLTSAMKPLNVWCYIRDIGSWKYIVFAMSGVSKEVKFYVNGKLCKSKKAKDANIHKDSEWPLSGLSRFLFSTKDGETSVGVSMMDDLSFYKSFPASDAQVHKDFFLTLKFG